MLLCLRFSFLQSFGTQIQKRKVVCSPVANLICIDHAKNSACAIPRLAFGPCLLPFPTSLPVNDLACLTLLCILNLWLHLCSALPQPAKHLLSVSDLPACHLLHSVSMVWIKTTLPQLQELLSGRHATSSSHASCYLTRGIEPEVQDSDLFSQAHHQVLHNYTPSNYRVEKY